MVYTFGTFSFDPSSLELTREGRRVAIEPQPAKALVLLLARAGEVVSRDELRQALWGGETHVDYDRGLAYCVGQIRTALGEAADQPRFVQTLPKRGFRFIAPVRTVTEDAVTAMVAAVPPEPWAAGATDTRPTPVTPSGQLARRPWAWALAGAAAVVVALAGWRLVEAQSPVVVAVSIFDNETGEASLDAFATGLSDVVVTRLTALAPGRLGVVGNAAALRQPRNIRNLRTLAQVLDADYVVLGQLQRQDTRLRFIVHFIRLDDGVHLSAQRFVRSEAEVHAFEGDVVAEVERVVRSFALAGA